MTPRPSRGAVFAASILIGLLTGSCRREPTPLALPDVARAAQVEDTALFQHTPIGAPVEGRPWIAHVSAADLDRDGHTDVIACEARENKVVWLRQTSPGNFEETTLAADMRAPVHAEAVDIDGDGDLDILVASMSVIFPDNDKIGTLFILENDGHQHFTKHIILENVARVTDVRAGDFNGDGKLDLAVGQFGYDQGEVQWLERVGPWAFMSHNLLNLAGTINVVVADFNGDHAPDIAAIVSQQWEEIHFFQNDGKGNFQGRVLWGSTNEDYASSGLTVGDLNRDGKPDLIFTNGDGFGPASIPGPRPWHGVQWLENLGSGNFRFHRIGNLAGAYSPVCVDLDGDGAMDVLAISAFNDWEKPESVSLMWFKNNGDMTFAPHVLAHTPTHLLTAAVGDFDGSGQVSFITGAMHAYPPYNYIGRLELWSRPKP
ncbi:MAG TPA: VCBS repeat-containing protein [Opitutaceae bacterium]|nr:VCBS repeat-containing protein [Opitutaceae bacterium]